MLAPIWGRWGLPVPLRIPITFVLGDELLVQKAEGVVDDVAVGQLHSKLLDSLQHTFSSFSDAYGWSDRRLEFV